MSAESQDSKYLHRSLGFGFRWQSEIPLVAFQADPDAAHDAHISIGIGNDTPPERDTSKRQGRVQFAADGFRYLADEESTIDAYWSGRAEIYPGPAWTGRAPSPLFGTVTALLLAARGCIPLHGSAVAVDGQAVLFCGAAGSGKSTSAARLIAQGGQLISDDLSVLHPDEMGGPPRLFAGRRPMRLFAEAAGALGRAVEFAMPPEPVEGKLAVFPPQVEALAPMPLAKVIVLGASKGKVAADEKGGLLVRQLFRPVLLSHMGGHKRRLAMLAIAAQAVEIVVEDVL